METIRMSSQRYKNLIVDLTEAKQSSKSVEILIHKLIYNPAINNKQQIPIVETTTGKVKDFYIYPIANKDCERSDCDFCGDVPIEISFHPGPGFEDQENSKSMVILFSIRYDCIYHYSDFRHNSTFIKILP